MARHAADVAAFTAILWVTTEGCHHCFVGSGMVRTREAGGQAAVSGTAREADRGKNLDSLRLNVVMV